MDNQPKKRSFARSALKVLVLLAAMAYLTVCLLLAVEQRHIIYLPPRFTAEQADARAKKAGVERWRDASGEAIGFKRPSSRQPASSQVLIVYGNASSATGCAHYADEIQNVGAVDVFILNYPGYEDRAGLPTEKNLYHAADQALQSMATNLPTYVFGESLGTGVAAYLAGTQPDRIAGLVLLSPYDDLANMAQYRYPILPARFLLIDRFPSANYLRNYRGPVAAVVDGRDVVVPEKFGKRLYEGYAGPKRLWEYPGSGHITIGEPPAKFWSEVLDFWQTSHTLASQAHAN
jgi:alpha-beta hydrolase superfamily lysophospholipase